MRVGNASAEGDGNEIAVARAALRSKGEGFRIALYLSAFGIAAVYRDALHALAARRKVQPNRDLPFRERLFSRERPLRFADAHDVRVL